MDNRSRTFDWNQLRAFLATAETGSFSAAARALKSTQPTITRQVAQLETELGVTLFERGPRATTLTEAGRALLSSARAMQEAAGRISLTAARYAETLEGEVVISASDAMCSYWLPQIIGDIRRHAPGVRLRLVSENTISDLQKREADIAIRHVRPNRPELTARLVRETKVHLYATQSYLSSIGDPERPQDLKEAAFIGFEEAERFAALLNEFGVPITPDNFRIVTTSSAAGWEMVQSGLGIGFMAPEIAETVEDMQAVLSDLVSIPFQIWLAAHRELHTNPRIRLVFDVLAAALSKRGELTPRT